MDEGTPVPLQLKPGIVKEKTPYDAEGSWIDSSLVRFNFGQPENWRGWQFMSDATNRANYVGHARDLLPWTDLNNRNLIAIANEKKLYVWESGVYYNITPALSIISTSNFLTTTSGSSNVIVSINSHNAAVGDFVGFISVSATIGGSILLSPGLSVRSDYEITSVIDTNSFLINTGTTATATSISTGQGNIVFYLGTGQKDFQFLYGWGTGTWGTGFWGTGAGGSNYATMPTVWSLDNWGENLVACRKGGPIYLWENNLNELAVAISGAPSQSNTIIVAPEDRFLIALGTMDLTSVFDPFFIRWCSRENYNDWTASVTNTAGSKRLSSGGAGILGARRSRGQILIWTDHDMVGMRFVGGSFVYGFDTLGEDCGIIAPHAHAETGGVVYWMSNERFYVYDGTVNILPCTVLDYIFKTLDFNNKSKIYSGTIPAANEVIWFYPSTDSPDAECDRYITYNHVDKAWAIGMLPRTVWSEDHIFDTPIAVGTSGEGLFYQELGRDAAGSAMNCYIESAYFDPGEGKDIVFLSRVIPDFSNYDATSRNVGELNLTFKAKKYQSDAATSKGPFVVTSTTKHFNPRLRGRQIAVRLESTGQGIEWRMGKTQMFLQPDGEA